MHNPRTFKKFLHLFVISYKRNLIPGMQFKGAIRNDDLLPSLHRTNQDIAMQLLGNLKYPASMKHRIFRNHQLHQLGAAFRKRIHLHNRREFDQTGNFQRRLHLRINDHGQIQFFSDMPNFLYIFRRPDAGNRMAFARLFGNKAAEHIQLVGICSRNQKICLLNARVDLYLIAHAVSFHAHHVDVVRNSTQPVAVLVNHRDFMPLLIQLLGKSNTDFPAANNNNFHPYTS